MTTDCTVIMPAFNNQEILDTVLATFLASNVFEGREKDKVRFIVVDDGSNKPIVYNHEAVRVIRHTMNKGVGTAFDTGVAAAETERIVLMGSDVIVPPDWYGKVTEILDDYPLSITCSICSGFSGEQKPFREGRSFRYGAYILREHNRKFGDRIQPDIIQAKWNRGQPQWEELVGEIGCILGAFYFTTRSVYNAIGGWMGHKMWGGLEPMISLRAKRSGYKLYVARYLETCHNFGRVTKTRERGSRWDMYFYNKLLMAHTMLEDPQDLIPFLYSQPPTNWLRTGERLLRNTNFEDIREFHRQNWINGLIKPGEEL